ncbi:transcriptional regulator, XRE family with cupin sensor [Desulfacinum infernum DSM 9756]|uniref:Transcriptional regulator, XRE family with cupin sensor n=1 Tax=Desulfacinum infernum DSM 9756 TaxID=1121391 RepID=A0A1M5BSE5_9BACT|nr:XRE family transcriptional regulator [Desulfacinum infernum]SHF45197.1 transcriptional regulator, XRE family with cupin sensor [Desulfacinum infernum DSM 9756]
MAGQDDIQLAVKALKIGQKVRELRQQYKYTLQDLAQKTGLSKPFLSQIENDHVVPPIATLMKLARALNVGLAHFFQDEESDEKISITRPQERSKVERRPHQSKGEVNYIYESLEFRKRSKHMEPFLVEFRIQDADRMVFQSHSGEEFLYILEGELEFRTVDRVEILRPGDSIYFDSEVSHSFRCLSEKPAKAVAVLYSPSP